MRTLRIHGTLFDVWACWVQTEVRAAKLAFDPLAKIFTIDLQFLHTFWAVDENACRYDFNHRIKLLKGNEDSNLHAVPFEIRVQQFATVSAMNHRWRHVIATIRAGPPDPCRHGRLSENLEKNCRSRRRLLTRWGSRGDNDRPIWI